MPAIQSLHYRGWGRHIAGPAAAVAADRRLSAAAGGHVLEVDSGAKTWQGCGKCRETASTMRVAATLIVSSGVSPGLV